MDVEKSYNGMHGFSSTSPFSIRAFDLHNGSRKVSSRASTVPDLHRSAWGQPGWYLMTAAVSVRPRCVKIMDPFSWHRISIHFRSIAKRTSSSIPGLLVEYHINRGC